MKLQVVDAKGRDKGSFELSEGDTLLTLKQKFQKSSRLSIHRQGFKIKTGDKVKNLSGDAQTLVSLGITDGATLVFKDLGPQIGYRTVFLLEYFGPMLFVFLYTTRPAFLYGAGAAAKPFDKTAYLGVVCWTIHFMKRELETIFVHRFSRPTMPLFNLFKNCAYYWTFGAVIGYPLCHPDYQGPKSDFQVNLGLAIFAVSEFLNFCVHVQLRTMRAKEGSSERPIPKGPLFLLVSCPNYTFEILGWVGFSIFTQIFFGYLFTLVGFLQMAQWALQKHSGYYKTYGDEYKRLRRKALVPFIL
ncbi:3-oxo-5-alpha-steroid 4-dehydrogenase [Thraustotheca clavata]|uniref:3-oxo-5-alpha-steroid 4-dehydrogenase n=1 Tax=Thraustotheca clavata TaxID=74557 RepID=A0A1V9YS51_9STRA|nr:3-oxo-5-alpha-steroid 4-dehydrogenase [Thraustotheca clavata]